MKHSSKVSDFKKAGHTVGKNDKEGCENDNKHNSLKPCNAAVGWTSDKFEQNEWPSPSAAVQKIEKYKPAHTREMRQKQAEVLGRGLRIMALNKKAQEKKKEAERERRRTAILAAGGDPVVNFVNFDST